MSTCQDKKKEKQRIWQVENEEKNTIPGPLLKQGSYYNFNLTDTGNIIISRWGIV